MEPVVVDTDVLSFTLKQDTRAAALRRLRLITNNAMDYAGIPNLEIVTHAGV